MGEMYGGVGMFYGEYIVVVGASYALYTGKSTGRVYNGVHGVHYKGRTNVREYAHLYRYVGKETHIRKMPSFIYAASGPIV